MSLNYNAYRNDLKDIRNKMKKIENEQEADSYFLDKNVEAIKKLLESATVTITVLPSEIKVAGSAASQTNVSPITLKGNDLTHRGGLS